MHISCYILFIQEKKRNSCCRKHDVGDLDSLKRHTCELLTGTFEAGGVKPPLWPRLVKIGGEVVNY